ncbi:MAG: hypothetical protein ACOC9S_05465 [Planctomycetota bacterium]
MRRSVPFVFILALAVLTLPAVSQTQSSTDTQAAETQVVPDTQRDLIGRKPPQVPDPFRNPYPDALEEGFLKRSRHIIQHYKGQKVGGNTWGENEKGSYPRAMFAILNGNVEVGADFLQKEDAGHSNVGATHGIDYYWCFTLKGQMRKYFLFGDLLDSDYRKRMRRGAKKWTASDPLNVRKKWYTADNWGNAWDPNFIGSDVDIRNTDNLRAMRQTSVYLMAEETGNRRTAELYKKRIRDYVQSLYWIGMGEWDSANYMGHTMAPYHNLYDFAKDPEVKRLAKAALDWLYAAAAVKYYRAAWGGPSARCYNNRTVVFQDGPVHPCWLYFGDNPKMNPHGHYDDVHHITSAYRPPPAVVALARKRFDKPVTLSATKPEYDRVGYRPPWENWTLGDPRRPHYWETLHVGRTFQLASVVSPEPDSPKDTWRKREHWNVLPWKLVTHNSQRGADVMVVSTHGFGPAWKPWGQQIAQHDNLMILLDNDAQRNPDGGGVTFTGMIPKSAKLQREGDVWFIRFEKTWAALRPIRIDVAGIDEQITAKLNKRRPDEQAFTATGPSGRVIGFALEVADGMSYADFKRGVKSKAALEVSGDTAVLTGIDGKTLKARYNHDSDLPMVWRDGERFVYDDHLGVYEPLRGPAVIEQTFHGGEIRVRAGGKTFTGRVSEDGEYTFSNE